MANSGSATTSTVWDGYFWVSWSLSSQSVTNNTSTVSWSCGVYSPHRWYQNAIKMSAVSINGNTVYGGGTYSFGGNIPYTYTFGSGSLTIGHNANGNANVSIGGFNGWFYEEGTVYSGGGTWALPTIARASALSLDKTSITADGYSRIVASVTKRNTSFTDRMILSCGNKSKEIALTGSGANYTGVITIEPYWINEFAPSTSGTGKVKVTTYSGASPVGSNEVNITITQNRKSATKYGMII